MLGSFARQHKAASPAVGPPKMTIQSHFELASCPKLCETSGVGEVKKSAEPHKTNPFYLDEDMRLIMWNSVAESYWRQHKSASSAPLNSFPSPASGRGGGVRVGSGDKETIGDTKNIKNEQTNPIYRKRKKCN